MKLPDFKEMSTSQLIKFLLMALGISIFLVAMAYIWVWRPLQIRNELRDYDRAREVQADFRQKVEERIGPADEVTTEESCTPPRSKGAKGVLSCQSSIRLRYNNTDLERANEILSDASSLFPQDLRNDGVTTKDQERYENPDIPTVLRCSWVS
jgi:hypothetical protein